MNHTPEPWKLRGSEIGKAIVSDDQNHGMMLAIAFVDKYDFEDAWDANARRIVACVNACTGISTDIIEQNSNKVSDLLTQRDNLLKFTQSIKDFAEKYPHDVGLYDHVKYELSILDVEL